MPLNRFTDRHKAHENLRSISRAGECFELGKDREREGGLFRELDCAIATCDLFARTRKILMNITDLFFIPSCCKVVAKQRKQRNVNRYSVGMGTLGKISNERERKETRERTKTAILSDGV